MSLSKEIVKFNSNTQSRDKIFRLAQYGSRLILWQLTYGCPDVQGEVVNRLRKLEGALGLSRKWLMSGFLLVSRREAMTTHKWTPNETDFWPEKTVFRLGNFLDLGHKTIDALFTPPSVMMLLSVTSNAMKAIWLFIDHLLWFGKVGVVKISLPFWTQWSLRAWLVALLSASISDYIKIQLVQNQVQKHWERNGKGTQLPANLQKDMHTVRMNFWRDFCDMFIPLGGLSYVSPGLAALCGVVSSAIGFRQEWEKHITPFKPSV